MNRLPRWRAVLAPFIASSGSEAMVLSGGFSGRAIHSRINAMDPTPGNFGGAASVTLEDSVSRAGVPVGGGLQLSLLECLPQPGGDGGWAALAVGGRFRARRLKSDKS